MTSREVFRKPGDAPAGERPAPRQAHPQAFTPASKLPMPTFPPALLLAVALLPAVLLAGCTHPAHSPAATRTPQAAPDAALAAVPVPYDQWFVDAADGKKTGWSRRTLKQDAAGRWISADSSYSAEMHGGDKVESSGSKVTVETADFKPVSITATHHQKSASGQQTVVQEWRFTDTGIELTSRQGETEMKRTLPAVKGRWFTPAKAAAILRTRVLAGDKQFEIPMFDPGLGSAPYQAIYARQGEQVLPLSGGPAKVTKYKMTYSNMPGVNTYECYDAKGDMLHNTFSMSGIAITNQTASPELAQAPFAPSESTGMSVVQADKPIPTPSLLRRAVYELNYAAECPTLPPVTRFQSVEKIAPGRVKVTVDLDGHGPTLKGPQKEDLGASIMIDFKDASVQALVPVIFDRFAGAELADDLRGRVTTSFVSRYLSDGATLNVASATASATAKSKAGDCTEHAVLLAALLRAQGIPARCATGLSYAGDDGFVDHKNVFVYHMWTQAWLKDDNGKARWVDLDAAMRRYDAVHILLGTSSMDDATSAEEETKIMPMMEHMKVKVLETAR